MFSASVFACVLSKYWRKYEEKKSCGELKQQRAHSAVQNMFCDKPDMLALLYGMRIEQISDSSFTGNVGMVL
jgi:hypothetical protein